jgi:glycine cleavage system regulatory protein
MLALNEWQAKEKGALNCAVDEEGCLLDNLTLELRVHPPEIHIDNASDPASTVVTIDSANRPGSLVYVSAGGDLGARAAAAAGSRPAATPCDFVPPLPISSARRPPLTPPPPLLRPSALLQVVQHFTELGLRINSARISSDGGWFHDAFHVCESDGKKVRDAKKLRSIKQMLNVYMADEELVANSDETDDMARVETTVLELSGADAGGLLADVTHLLTHNGCNVRSAAVWTYRGRVAFVLSVTEKGQPVENDAKLTRLRELVTGIMRRGGGTATVRIARVRGEVHHERRLHQLMLEEELAAWDAAHAAGGDGGARAAVDAAAAADAAADAARAPATPSRAGSSGSDADYASSLRGGSASSSPADSSLAGSLLAGAPRDGGAGGGAPTPFRSPKFDRPAVDITHSAAPDYWVVAIACRDRAKLVFDSVCTLADLDFDIFHATVDAAGADGVARQEFFVRPRAGARAPSPAAAARLRAMLIASIERRFPRGVKVHVRSLDRFGCLAALARQLYAAGLAVTRAKVRTYATSKSAGHTLYVMTSAGAPPGRAAVQAACEAIGGRHCADAVEAREGRSASIGAPGASGHSASAASDGHRFSFSFSFLARQFDAGWRGSPGESQFGSPSGFVYGSA